GKKWKGRAVVINMDSRPKGTTQGVPFVAKGAKQFRHFTLSIPAKEWKNNSRQYLAVLGTIRSPDSGQRQECVALSCETRRFVLHGRRVATVHLFCKSPD